ncbi:MAG: Wzz/FepE/Etk N-terminal domain-containing protein [Chitinophagaceae bacterium]
MDLMYLLYSLLRKKWIILACSVLGLIAGFVFTLFMPKNYVSLAQYSTGFTIQQKVKITQDESYNVYEIDMRFNNLIETFRSPKVMGMLSYKLLLHDLEDRHPFRTLSSNKMQSEAYKNADLEAAKVILRHKILQMELISPFNPEEKKVFDLIGLYGYDDNSLGKNISFDRVGHTDFINIFFKSESPELSAYVVNTIGAQFIRFFNSIYGLRTQESTAKLDSLTAAKKRVVDSLTDKFQEYKAKIGTPNVADRSVAAMDVVREMTSKYNSELAKLNGLRGDLNAVEIQLQSIETPGADASSGGNNNAAINELKRKNSDLDLQKNGKNEDEIKRLQDQIDANMREIQRLSSGSSRATDAIKAREKAQNKRDDLINKKIELQQAISASETNVSLFRKQKDEYDRITSSGGGEEVILQSKETQLRIATQEYETLNKSLQSSLDVDVNPENNFQLTIAGQPSYKPEPTRRTVIVALVGVLMFMLSTFIFAALEFMDSSFRTPSIFQRTSKLKLLSSVNEIDLKKRELNDYFKSGSEAAEEKTGKIFVENLRKLRYELEISGKKIFLITSTQPRQGKTVIIESLANSLCLTKKKVLLIDANFINNTLTQKFGAKPTLDQFTLGNNHNSMDKFWSITSMTTIPNTDVVGCTQGSHTPAEVLPKNNLLENLHQIAGSYDFIFIEGAALNNHADSKELSKYVEGIIAVFSARASLKHTDKESIEYLTGTGDKFVGAVFNLVQPENMEM